MTVTINYRGLIFTVDGTYHKATRDIMYMPNGDPGQPGDPAEFEIDSIRLGDVEMIDFIDGLVEPHFVGKINYYHDALESIESLCIEQAAEAEDYKIGYDDL